MPDITTLKISRKTKARLDNLKEHKRESYEEVIQKILYVLNRIRKDPISGNKLLGKIDNNIRRRNKQVKEIKQELNQEQNLQHNKGSH